MEGKGDGRRVARAENEILRLVAQYVIENFRGEIPGIITIARVQMPADLRAAKVYVSVLNSEGKIDGVVEALQKRAPEIQRFIGDNLRMRYCPKLTFYEDDMTKRVLQIDEVLRELAEQKSKTEKAD